MKLKYKLIIVSFILVVSLQAQKGWEVGPFLGVSNYFGDLNTSYDFTEIGPAAGALARYNFNNRINAKFEAQYTFIRGNDKDSPNSFEIRRNLSFKTDIIDASAQLEFNFFPYIHGSKDYNFTPYLSGGLAVLAHSPKARLDGEWHRLRPLGTEGQGEGEEYNFVTGAFVIGGGFKWDLNEDWSINIEVGARALFSDYIDDVSGTYASQASLRLRRGEIAALLADRSEGEKIGEPGRQRGNSRDNDNYTIFGVALVYYFGNLQCPDLGKSGRW